VRVIRFGLAALLLLAGCGSVSGPYTWVTRLSAEETPEEAAIQPRDTILVEVRNQKELSGEFLVREDGNYTQPMVGSVRVAGVTPTAAAQMLNGLLRGIVVDPRVAVWISRPAPIRVNVVGEVRTPGTYELNRDRTVLGALSAAGWINEYAKHDSIFVVRATDKSRVRFSLSDVVAPEGPSTRFRLRDGDAVIAE
jgi:polysaccharide export outer membrane protein